MDAAVLGSRNGLRLELYPAVSTELGPMPMWRAVLVGRGLDASLVFAEAGWEPQSLADFLDSIAADWRGWDVDRRWQSGEAEMRLLVRHDKTNTVLVRVQLENGAPPHWRCDVELEVDPGVFQQLAVEVRQAFL